MNNFIFFSNFLILKKKNYTLKKKIFLINDHFNSKLFLKNFSVNLNNYKKEKIDFKTNSISKLKTNRTVEHNCYLSNNFFFINKKKIITLKFVKLIFFFDYSLSNKDLKKIYFYNFFFLSNQKKSLTLINASKLLKRWENSYNLIFNIFYYNYNPLIFSNPLFKNSTLSLNWFIDKWEMDLWKYYFSFFVYKTNKFSTKIDFFYEKLKEFGYEFFLITDSLYHFKNLYYFKKHFFYTIGLSSISVNPWILDYPIVSFVNSYLIQFFFIKLLIYIQKQSLMLKFFFLKKIWINNLFFKNSINHK